MFTQRHTVQVIDALGAWDRHRGSDLRPERFFHRPGQRNCACDRARASVSIQQLKVILKGLGFRAYSNLRITLGL